MWLPESAACFGDLFSVLLGSLGQACCLTGVQDLAQALLCSGSFQHRNVT